MRLPDPDIGTGRWLFLHVVDTVGLVHAMILRMQALLCRCRPWCSAATDRGRRLPAPRRAAGECGWTSLCAG